MAEVLDRLSDGDPRVRLDAVLGLRRFGDSALPHLIRLLQGDDSTLSGAAEQVLIETGASAVPALIHVMESRDERISYSAGTTLVRMGAVAVPGLLDALTKRSGTIRAQIARTLGSIGESAERSVPALARLLADSDPEIRLSAAIALAGIGQAAIPSILDALRSDQSDVREAAACALADAQATPPVAIPLLLAAAADDIPAVRRAALRALVVSLRARSSSHPQVVKTVLAALRDPNSGVVIESLKAVGSMPELGRGSIDTIAGLLSAEDFTVRIESAYALSNIGSDAAPAVPRLVACANDNRQDNWGARKAAVVALEAIGPSAAEAVPCLLRLLSDPIRTLRTDAASALGAIGPAASVAVPRLREIASDRDEYEETRAAAETALASLGMGDPHALIRCLQSTDPHIRSHAAIALGRAGLAGRPAAPALLRALADSDEAVSLSALQALVELAPHASEVAPELWAIVGRDPNSALAIRVSVALGRTGKPGLDIMTAALRLGDRRTEQRLLDAFRAMGHTAVPSLLPMLKDPNPEVRHAAARALGSTGWHSDIALNDLVAALGDADDSVCHSAAAALATQGETVLPPLEATLKGNAADRQKRFVIRTLLMLSLSGTDVGPVVPSIRLQLKATDPALQTDATHILALIDGQ